jgi:hypothetical protein
MSATSQTLRRLVGTWTLEENSEHTFDIPRIQDIESVVVELDAVVTLTGAGSGVRAEAPAHLLSNVQFIAGGKDVLDDRKFTEIVFANYKRRFQKSIVQPAGATVAAHTVRAVGRLDRINVNGARDKDTSFQAWLTQILQLRVVTGAGVDIFTDGGTLAGSVTSGTVKVYVVSRQELDKSKVVDGKLIKVPNSSDQGEPKRVVKRTKQSHTFTSANSAYQFFLPVGHACRAITIHAMDDTSGGFGEPSNTVINSAKLLVNDTDVKMNQTFAMIRDDNAADYNVDESAMPDGFGIIDSSPNGKFREYFDFRGTPTDPVTRAVLELDLAAPTTEGIIEVTVEEDIY